MLACKRRVARRLQVPLIVAAAAAGALTLSASALADGPGQFPGQGAGSYVYLDDNTAGANTIAGFARQANGTLTPLPGSPFAAGGAGTAKGLASQGAVQVSSDGRYLLAVDAGSNQISVLQIQHDGSLQPVAGGVVSSGGIDPVSIAVHDGLVYVANAGAGGSNYTGFRLTFGGRLIPIPSSTVALPNTAQPGDVLFNGEGTKLVGTRVASSQIDSFTVGWNGLLTASPGSPYSAQGLGPLGSEFRPNSPNQLFISNAHNGAGLGSVSAFNDGFNGSLTSIGSSPVADLQTAPCWVVISPDGQYLYAVNTGSGTISSYWISPGGTLTLIGSTAVANTGGVGAVDVGISADGRTLYVNESRVDAVGEFAVNGGTLTELAGSPIALPAGAAPAGIAVTTPWFFWFLGDH